jgi:hypothetical protein
LPVSRAIVRGVVGAPKSRATERIGAAACRTRSGTARPAAGRCGRRRARLSGSPRRARERRELAPWSLRRRHSERAWLASAPSHPGPHLWLPAHRERSQCADPPALDGTPPPAFTLETYGHLSDGDLGPAPDLQRSCDQMTKAASPVRLGSRRERFRTTATAGATRKQTIASRSERALRTSGRPRSLVAHGGRARNIPAVDALTRRAYGEPSVI